MAGKFTLSTLVAFFLFFSVCATSRAAENTAPETSDKDKAVAVSPTPEAKDPKEEAKENYILGLGSMTHGNWKKAEEYFLVAIKFDPDHYNTRMYLARVYENMGKHTAAIEQYKEAMKLKPNEPSPYVCLMGVYLDMGLLDFAISTAADATKKGIPGDTFAGDLGWAYYMKGDFGNAEKYLNIEKGLKKADSTPRNNLGLVYFKQGRYDDALASFIEASELNKNSIVLPYFLALTYNRLGKEDETLKALKEGIKRDPGLEARVQYYNGKFFPKSDPGDLSATFKKLKEEKN